MGFHEEQWLNNFKDSPISFYCRYVDDTFCVFNKEQDAMLFLSYFFKKITLSRREDVFGY